MRGWVIGWGLAVLAALCGAEANAGEGVWLSVEQNGVFGGGSTRTVFVSALGPRLRVTDPATQRAFYVDREAREVVEVDTLRRVFVRKPFAAYARLREERATRRAEQLKRIRALREAAEDDAALAELDARLQKLGLRLDGEEHVRSSVEPPRYLPLVLGAVSQPMLARPTRLYINTADEPVAVLQVAPHLDLPVAPLDFYVALGMLPEPLEAALSELKGTILAGELLLDDGSLKKRVRFRVLEVRSGVRFETLTPPSGLTEVQRLDKPDAPVADGTCLHCDGPLNGARITLNGRSFCSREHRHAYIKASAKQR